MKHIGEVMRELNLTPNGIRRAVTLPKRDGPKCALCGDAGWLRMQAPVGHPNFGRLIPCACTVQQQEAAKVDDLRRLSNLEGLSDRTFQRFDHRVDGVSEAYLVAREYARNPDGWLFLHGACGVGKTHLAVAVALEFRDMNKGGVLFSVVPDLLDQLRATFDPATGVAYDDRFNQIRNCQLLILDDLGTENTTPWAREKLYQIFNHRYNEQLPTVVTSNQPFARIEERILSRLLDTRLTRYVHVDAEDFRRQTRPGGGPARDHR